MQAFVLTLKNYRCFTDEYPLRLEIGEGFTALIGPNNSGKSSALRMIYELRHLWQNLRDRLLEWFAGPEFGFGGGSIQDADDIFTNLNGRDIVIEFEFPWAPPDNYPYLSKLIITFPRGRWGVARPMFFVRQGENEQAIPIGPCNRMERGISHPSAGGVDTASFLETMSVLCDSIYIGAFRNAINQGAGQYYDINVGTGFVSLWNSWKVGSTKANMDKTLSVTKTIQDLFGFDSLEINAHANDQNLVVVVNGRSYLLNELGSGLAQFIIVLGNVAIRAPALILVDEPELNLHPSLQQKFLLQLASYASQGTIYATHSLGLARSTSANIYSFQSRSGVSHVHRFEATPGFGELMGEMGFSSYRELGYDRVLLVEGVTDAPVYREFLRKLKADHKVLVIPLGGNQLARGDVEHELQELKRLSDKVFALVDSERTSEDQPPCNQRTGFKMACEVVGIPVLLTERRATENYLADRAIKRLYGQSQREFLPFESRTDVGPCWKKGDNWKVAAEMNFEEIAATDVGKFLKDQVVGS